MIIRNNWLLIKPVDNVSMKQCKVVHTIQYTMHKQVNLKHNCKQKQLNVNMEHECMYKP